ncbi:DUF3995 domain-containing protein [Deinococcus radiopugnans]|uniref:DUF3995 domain-containing protein n=1 Tax=Deinococcus radiopugnans ATCC 19172 TaxID=585398 RepID=A0A5C4Y842_9DEIO|nr:DUF3995 domain-containing protein [Deinococcus radiopugnans]MBB6017459.1 hypothetical protein [Deinococcus radiopugnans ATCC 19172]TNM71985.1 DUF3995 domain-containing protein [Deinococcus radiopugnans ATCC 19172]
MPQPSTAYRAVSIGAALLTGTIATVHVYWAAGGTVGLTAALPEADSGALAFTPPPVMTLGVAAGLASMGVAALDARSPRVRWPLRLTTLMFLLRAVGDGREVGLTRLGGDSLFARNDARLYTPLCLVPAALYGVLAFRPRGQSATAVGGTGSAGTSTAPPDRQSTVYSSCNAVRGPDRRAVQ